MGTKAKTMATLQVRFTTQLPPPWVAPKTLMEIPAGIKAEGLNKVLTQLLKTDEATSFRFVLSEELLGEDETLGQFIQAHDGSMETVLDVEYLEAMPEPEEGVTREHDDWVGAISTWADGVVLTGSYDGVARLWQDDELAGSMPGHESAIKSVVCFMSAQGRAAATGSKDHTMRLGSGEAHQEAVVDVAWMPNSSSMLASASHDKTTMLWDIRSPKLPVVTLTTHDDKVLCAHWADAQHILSGGADCKVRSAQVGN